MDKRMKYSLLAFALGLVVCVSFACSPSVSGENEAHQMMNNTQVFVSEPVVVAEVEKGTHKPIALSEMQYKQLVADFTTSDKKFKGEKPCVIDFWAEWCRPCRILAPTFEKMAEKYGDQVNFYKIEVDYCRNLSAAYNITAIPTLFFFDKKGTLNRVTGVPSEEELENAVKVMIK